MVVVSVATGIPSPQHQAATHAGGDNIPLTEDLVNMVGKLLSVSMQTGGSNFSIPVSTSEDRERDMQTVSRCLDVALAFLNKVVVIVRQSRV
ncbi:hypothetical protein Pcinc_014215 [Petrolisthes cinctipes]|uniref:Uncharacterized protein n=1 Tax=Petrolisthes cinctipes TaxID=88211 RepID=A0AAE1G0T2_PETCI|nr:hypothetical protein Pcinc_014215 [Petrolisthes cinctipes]